MAKQSKATAAGPGTTSPAPTGTATTKGTPFPSAPQHQAVPSPARRRMVAAYGAVGLSIVVAVVAVLARNIQWTVQVQQFKDWLFAARPCADHHANCAFWAGEGECDVNPDYMTRICAKSCKVCSTTQGRDDISTKAPEAFEQDDEEGEEEDAEDANAGYGEEEEDETEEEEEETPTPRFLTEEEAIDVNDEDEQDSDCVDSDSDCPMWAERGECEINPNYMLENCRKSCNTCNRQAGDGDETANCSDLDPDCPGFAERGECDANPEWMLENCKRSCGVCGDNEDDIAKQCSDNHKDCRFWASIGECDANPNYMLEHCKKSCKVCGSGEAEDDEMIGNLVEQGEDVDAETQVECKNKHPDDECESRRRAGDCERNPGWTIVFCAKSCGKCDLLLQKARCVPEVFNDTNYRYENVLKQKGDLSRIFERILKEHPTTEVLLRPPKGPWVLKFPKFVTPLERETILNLTLPHVRRSTDQGGFTAEGIQEQVVSSGRTSSNAWCLDECSNHPVVKSLTERISKLVQAPTVNFESFQVLQYKLGQKYDTHHDSSEEDINEMAGPRILTFFIYFTDVEEGGETFFDKLGLKVKPEMGSAILWPSVQDDDPHKIDWRTTHAALPVIKGEKLAANVWVHMRDFETANLWGCTGAFDE